MNENNTQRNVVGLLGLAAVVGTIWWVFNSTKKGVHGIDHLKVSDVKVGDYLVLNTGDEVAKVKVTKIRDKYGRPEIDGEVKVNGKKKLVAVLHSDFENGFVKKIKSGTKVKQKLKS